MNIQDLAKFQPVDDWLTLLASEKTGSERTRITYLRALARFCDVTGMNPDKLIELGKQDRKRIEMMVAKHLVAMEQSGIKRNSCVTHYGCIRSFFRYNDIMFTKRTPQTWVEHRARALSKAEIKKIMEEADPRLKVFIAIMKDTGLAPVDVLLLKCGDIDLTKIPPIAIERIRSKTKLSFTTFVGQDVVEYLGRYLTARQAGTRRVPPEKIGPESPLFRTQETKVRPLSYNMVLEKWNEACARAGIKGRPYDLRKFFNTQLRLGGETRISDDLIEYWMGHKLLGPRGAYLVPTVQEQAKEYARAYPRLSLTETEAPEALKQQWKQQLLGMLSLNSNLKPDQREIIRKELDKFRDLNDVDWEAMRALVEKVK